jgi:hypothetical protein
MTVTVGLLGVAMFQHQSNGSGEAAIAIATRHG